MALQGGPRAHDGTIIPKTVDTMWGTDLTTVFTGEGQAAVFIAVDHCSAECVGIHAHARATRFEALEPIRQAVRQHFGGFAQGIAKGLAVRHDHGSQYMSDHFQLTFRKTYNTTWQNKQHGFISPADYRRQQLQPRAKAA